jgi:hypothetical protein
VGYQWSCASGRPPCPCRRAGSRAGRLAGRPSASAHGS